jgi:hypothetical protein
VPKVQLIAKISGTRNGEDWPAPGGVIDLPAGEAADLIASGVAKAVEKSIPKVEAAVTPKPETATRPGLSKGSTGL